MKNGLTCHKDPAFRVKLKFELGHLYLEWHSSVVLFSRADLVKLHRRFAYPSARKLAIPLRKAAPEQYDSNTLKLLQEITASCQSCQRMAPKPLVFQVTMPDDIQFNHEVIMDLAWVEPRPHRPVLHVVDRGTHFSAAVFLEGENAESVWNAFVSCWVSIYIGFPNVVKHDYGSCFNSEFFQKSCKHFGIITKKVPFESHNSLGPVERYHAPLKRIYKKLKHESPDMDDKLALSTAVHGLNNKANPEGLIPTLFVFGTIP